MKQFLFINFNSLITLFGVIVFLIASAVMVKCQTTRGAVFNLTRNDQSICTATSVITNRGRHLLLSAGHCVESESFEPGDTFAALDYVSKKKYPVRLLKSEFNWRRHVDYAVFEFTRKVPRAAIRTTRRIPKVGDCVTTIQGPLGYVPFFSRGYFSGFAYPTDRPWSRVNGMYWVQMPGTFGASGSPLINSRGEVWGILVGGDLELAGMVLAVPVPRLFGLATKN